MASPRSTRTEDGHWATRKDGLLLEERALDCDEAPKGKTKRGRPARSVTVNVAESPLGWLHPRGLVTVRQFDAGERLRADWERAQLAPRITMKWDAAPISSQRGGSSAAPGLSGSQIDAKRRFHAAIDHAGAGLGDILWRVVCSGEGMREAETALGWPAGSGKLVLTHALDRIADFHRNAKRCDPVPVWPVVRACEPIWVVRPVMVAFFGSAWRSRIVGSRMLFLASSLPLWLRIALLPCYAALNEFVGRDIHDSAGTEGQFVMILFGSTMSPFVRKAAAFAIEKGVDFELKPMGIRDADPAFSAASPFGKMPALQEGGFLRDKWRKAWASKDAVDIGLRARMAAGVQLYVQVPEVGEWAGDGNVSEGERVADQIAASVWHHAFQIIQDRREFVSQRCFRDGFVARPVEEAWCNDTIEEGLLPTTK